MCGEVLSVVEGVLPGVVWKVWTAYSSTVCQAILLLAIPIEPPPFPAWHQHAGVLLCCKYGLPDRFSGGLEGREKVVMNE